MEFKIETRESFSIITPVLVEMSAILADKLHHSIQENGQLGSSNLIVCLNEIAGITPDAVDRLVAWHEDAYSQNRSLVFTQPNAVVMKTFQLDEKDIISMEILERDLLSEE